MKIYDVRGIGANLTGSFSGSFGGVFAGTLDNVTVTASYVDYTNVVNKPTLISSSAQIGEYEIFATTGSNQFDGSQAITGSLTVTGEVVAQTLNVQQVTSSIVYSSGSNVFGNDLGNTQQFTGSLQVSGSSHNILGNVGIGEISAFGKLHIKTTDTGVTSPSAQGNLLVLEDSENGLSILSSTAGAGYINFGDSDDNDIGMIIYDHSANALNFWTNASQRMLLNSSGNLGLGVTPSAWGSAAKAMQIGSYGSFSSYTNELDISLNSYWNSGYKYTNTNPATLYSQYNGQHQWFNAPSGTAGNAISFTQAMTLNASGNLSIGNTNDTYKLDVTGQIRVNGNTNEQLILDFTTAAGGFSWQSFRLNGVNKYRLVGNVDNSFGIYSDILSAYPLTIASTGAATFSSSVTANQFISNATNVGDEYYFIKGNAAVNNNFSIYAYSNYVYLNAYNSINIRANNTGGSGGTINLTGGNVGIGTSSPTNGLLVINSTASNGVRFALESSGTMNGVVALGSNAISGLSTTDMALWTRGIMAFETGASGEKMRITSGGNVGIGNTNPLSKLHIGGALENSGDAPNAFIIKQTSTNETTGIYLERSGERKGYYIYVGGSVDSLNFQRNNAGTKADTMTLTRDGNVGIGLTTPQAILDVSHTAGTTNIIRVSNGAGNYRWRVDQNFAMFMTNASGTDTFGVTTSGAGFFSDNVGIGTNIPGNLLEVFAGASSRGIQVYGSSSPFIQVQATNNPVVLKMTADDTGGYLQVTTNHPLIFNTNNTERMRIGSAGDLLISTTTGSGLATGTSVNVGISLQNGVIASQVNNNSNQYWSKTTGYTSGDFTAHFVNNVYVGGISTNGSSTNYAVASDYRLKEDFQEIKGIEKVQAIKVYDYKWKESGDRMDGVIAHELQEVLPYAVTGEKDEMYEDGTEKMQGVDYSKIVPILIKAIQELKSENDTLKSILQRNNIT